MAELVTEAHIRRAWQRARLVWATTAPDKEVAFLSTILDMQKMWARPITFKELNDGAEWAAKFVQRNFQRRSRMPFLPAASRGLSPRAGYP